MPKLFMTKKWRWSNNFYGKNNNRHTVYARIKQGCQFATTFLVKLWMTEKIYQIHKKVKVRLR